MTELSQSYHSVITELLSQSCHTVVRELSQSRHRVVTELSGNHLILWHGWRSLRYALLLLRVGYWGYSRQLLIGGLFYLKNTKYVTSLMVPDRQVSKVYRMVLNHFWSTNFISILAYFFYTCFLFQSSYKRSKAATYNKRPKIKRDVRLKAVFFLRKRLLSVGCLSSFLGIYRTLRL